MGDLPAAPRRTIVIGDVHGCLDEVTELFDKVALTDDDSVVFAGDLIDRGPMRRECVELAMKHRAILGNHEDKHLQMRHRPGHTLAPDHAATRAVLEERHLDYFETLPLFLRIPEANAVVVHAGVLPNIPIERQPVHALLHAQCVRPPSTRSVWPSRAGQGWEFWTNFWTGPERVIFGHSVLDRPLMSKWAVGIDTGCVHGLALTAVILPEWTFVTVPARKKYWSSRSVTVPRYPVMDGVLCYS